MITLAKWWKGAVGLAHMMKVDIIQADFQCEHLDCAALSLVQSRVLWLAHGVGFFENSLFIWHSETRLPRIQLLLKHDVYTLHPHPVRQEQKNTCSRKCSILWCLCGPSARYKAYGCHYIKSCLMNDVTATARFMCVSLCLRPHLDGLLSSVTLLTLATVGP